MKYGYTPIIIRNDQRATYYEVLDFAHTTMNYEPFIKVVDAYDWEFVMIQYNYLDENNQAGKSGLKYAASKGLPVMIMEPLRGGKRVANLPKEVYKKFDSAKTKRSPAEWALKWIWDQPEVTLVLSGINSV